MVTRARRLLTIGQACGALILYGLEVIVLGAAMFPGALLAYAVWGWTGAYVVWQRVLLTCVAGAAGYFLYGVTLIVIVGLLRFVLRLKVEEGEYPLLSMGAVKWGLATALKSPVSLTFLNVLLMTPFAALFYRMMGARIGARVQINSKSCADPSLLEIGDESVIGGHATVVGHVFEDGKLILRKVTIGKRVIVGLNAVLLPGVEVGDGALIAAGAVVPKNTKIPARAVYMGSPTMAASESATAAPAEGVSCSRGGVA